jgi:hypothetical protein
VQGVPGVGHFPAQAHQDPVQGSQICEHDCIRIQCKECLGSGICHHQRTESKCKECGGSQICEHDRIRSECKVEVVEGGERCKVVEGSLFRTVHVSAKEGETSGTTIRHTATLCHWGPRGTRSRTGGGMGESDNQRSWLALCSLYLSMTIFLSISRACAFSPCLSVSVRLPLPACRSVCLSRCLSFVCLSGFLPVLPVNTSVCEPEWSPSISDICVCVCVRACVRACVCVCVCACACIAT